MCKHGSETTRHLDMGGYRV